MCLLSNGTTAKVVLYNLDLILKTVRAITKIVTFTDIDFFQSNGNIANFVLVSMNLIFKLQICEMLISRKR